MGRKGAEEMQPVRRWWLILVGVGLLLPVMSWPGRGIAGEIQETTQEIKYPYTFGPIVTSTAIPLAKGKFSLQPYWYLYSTNSKFSPNWRRINAGGDYASFETVLQLNYGLWDDLEVYAVVPFIQNWAMALIVLGRMASGRRISGDWGTFLYRLNTASLSRPSWYRRSVTC